MAVLGHPKTNPCDGNGGASPANDGELYGLDQMGHTDADSVKQHRRQNESRRIQITDRVDRHLGAMRMPMKERKNACNGHAGR